MIDAFDVIFEIVAIAIGIVVFVVALAWVTDSKKSSLSDKIVTLAIIAAGIVFWEWSVFTVAIPVAHATADVAVATAAETSPGK